MALVNIVDLPLESLSGTVVTMSQAVKRARFIV